MEDVSRKRVLIVDDSEIIRSRLYSLVLESQDNVAISMAGNVRQALQSLRSQRPQMVILDLRLPDGSGLEVLRQIKALSPGTIVAVLSNYAHTAYRARCAELGADFFFDKSLEFDKVASALRANVHALHGA